MSIDMDQYMGMFLEESKEHLQALNRCLLDLENDPQNLGLLDEIFRSAHTIKGMSATMGFAPIAELTHEMENILDMLRKSQLTADHDIVDTLFNCIDMLEQQVESVANNTGQAPDIHALVSQLSSLAKGEKPSHVIPVKSSEPSATDSPTEPVACTHLSESELYVIKAAEHKGYQAFEVQVILKKTCLLKSARAYMVMRALEELGEVIKSVPSTEDLEKEQFEYEFQVILLSDSDPEKISQTVQSISEIETVVLLPCLDMIAHPETGNVQQINSLPVTASEKPQANTTTQQDKKIKGGQSVRVDIDKLDSLLNLVGELVINKTRLEQIGITHKLSDLVETIEQMDRVTTDLQAVVMKVRMVPVGQVFNRFPRMVRDLSHELSKEINLVIQGEETELDRTVIDEIGDPLVHLLRNAIDHGIEEPLLRRQSGKNPIGEVRLIARHEGNHVVIAVEDDGSGINPEVIRRKAVEKGLISQADAEKMDNAEAVRMVFLPGFSTADIVTDISGRGVGMDAVKTKIESLGGTVEVETKQNQGSRFKIRLPLTLAIIQALLVAVGEEKYAIPLGSIDSTINIQPSDIKTVQNQEVILLRGQIIPIVRLANILSVPGIQSEHQELFVVVVHMGDHRAGIIVDTLIGQQEIVIKSLGKLLAGIKSIAGATILGDGQVALILDVGALMQ
ncbi:MAG: chemotaxis protein CheA [Anaerosporomusa subterranea]|jgi:two-component system chemotaxis sensor kinase CheA|nr:chemotaxis protein CheA [Anaerosporomusa subterranea]